MPPLIVMECYFCSMKNIIFSGSLVVLFLVSSCASDKDQAFCDCMKAGEELNNHSKELLTSEVTEEMAKKQQTLLTTKKEKCKDYEMMAGPEMLKRKQACEE